MPKDGAPALPKESEDAFAPTAAEAAARKDPKAAPDDELLAVALSAPGRIALTDATTPDTAAMESKLSPAAAIAAVGTVTPTLSPTITYVPFTRVLVDATNETRRRATRGEFSADTPFVSASSRGEPEPPGHAAVRTFTAAVAATG